jgi:hypothetical protein
LSFDAFLNNGIVELEWTTSTEINNEFFVIERSADGQNFQEIIRLKGAGTTYEQQSYAAKDYMPLKGISYYRLRQIDYDGKTEVFDPVLIDNRESTSNNLKVYPNPTDGRVFVAIPDELKKDHSLQLAINSMKGDAQLQVEITLEEGQSRLVLNQLIDFPSGVYSISLSNGIDSFSTKLVVQ